MEPLDRIAYAEVLLEIGKIREAEVETLAILEAHPDDLNALGLFAKIKHMRGELSEAVACWAHAHMRSPYHDTARMHLAAMLHLARDPERGASEFLAMGQTQLVRKPVAYLALEEAFRAVVALRPKEARAICHRVASKYADTDRDVYKIAVLAEAWIADMSGDLRAARECLERLGQERGFETDLDRVLALVDVYERIGDHDNLRAAVNICRFLERTYDHVPILGRLAMLYVRLGEDDNARTYQERHRRAFLKGMHIPSLVDVVHVAAKRYLPLTQLKHMRSICLTASVSLHSEASLLEQALWTILHHAHSRHVAPDVLDHAEELFQSDGTLLGRKYLADVAVLRGQHDLARTRYMQIFADDNSDARVLEWLVAQADPTCGDAIVQAYLCESNRYATVLQMLEAAAHIDPRDPVRCHGLAVVWSLKKDDPRSQERSRRYHARAVALQDAAGQRQGTIGRAQAAAVYNLAGKSKGLIHEIWVGREPAMAAGTGGTLPADHILGNMTHDMTQNVRNTFLAVREYCRARFPHLAHDIMNYTYNYKVTKEDEPSGGVSAGLPTALALLSVFLQRPLPQDIASTGAIVTDAHDVLTVAPVGDVPFKIRGAFHKNMRALLVPYGNRVAVMQTPFVPQSISAQVTHFVSKLDDAVLFCFGHDVFAP